MVLSEDWATGMGASLRARLADWSVVDADAVVLALVDLPNVGPDVVRRLLGAVRPAPTALARVTYHGTPGHPVLLGRDHWAGVAATAEDDRGARKYLRGHHRVRVERGDLALGEGVDAPTRSTG